MLSVLLLLCHAIPGSIVALEAKLAIKTDAPITPYDSFSPTVLHQSQTVLAPQDCLRSSFCNRERHCRLHPGHD